MEKKKIFPSNGRLLVHFPSLLHNTPPQRIDQYLKQKGYMKIEVDVVSLLREQLGKPYKLPSRYSHNPSSFDCSSLAQWIYAQKGMYIPRISIDQYTEGTPIEIDTILPGDLLFTKGRYCRSYNTNPDEGIGHVGIWTGTSVIHAANKKLGVIEDTLESFLENDFRGIRRMHPKFIESTTLILPRKNPVEYDDHLRWRILRWL